MQCAETYWWLGIVVSIVSRERIVSCLAPFAQDLCVTHDTQDESGREGDAVDGQGRRGVEGGNVVVEVVVLKVIGGGDNGADGGGGDHGGGIGGVGGSGWRVLGR